MLDLVARLNGGVNVQPRVVVKVVKVLANGKAVVEHVDSSNSVAIGSDLKLGMAYMEGDRIIGAAPDMPYTEIVI